MSITSDSTVTAVREHLSSDLPDETIILNLPRGTYFGVDGVAREIWRMIQEPTRVRDICAAIARQHAVPLDSVEDDVLQYLQDLQDNELVTVRPA